jgi:GT2 family glycosyltransferase
MRISLISIAYNLPESTRKLFETAMLDSDKHDISFQLFLHSLDPDTVEMCNNLYSTYPCKYYPYGTNRGLALSWNDGILQAYEEDSVDVIVIANDDIFFSEGDIDKLATKAASCRENYMISCAGYNAGLGKTIPSLGYSCFALNPIALDRLGMFDQNYYPLYGEDVDHHRRATLEGLVEANCDDTQVYHGGSSAIKKSPMLGRQNMTTQTKNTQYTIRKWNVQGLTGGFKTPFNQNHFNNKIEPAVRYEPYPGFNRDDQYIVRF